MEPADLAPSRCLLRHLEAEPLQPHQPVGPLQPLAEVDEEGEGLEDADRAEGAEGAEGAGGDNERVDEVVLRAGQWARAALFGFDAHGNALPLEPEPEH